MDEDKHRSENNLEETIQKLHNMRKKDRGVIAILAVSVAFVIIVGIAGYYLFIKELRLIRTAQKDQYQEHLTTNQFLLSTIDWSTLRTKTILYMRDVIVSEWRRAKIRVDLDEAYRIAETNMKECENFPYMDPFIILAMQSAESAFRKDMVSPMGAIGLNQIMPSTGRLLSACCGWSYSDSLLYNIKTSTHMAVKLLDVLYAQYNRWDLVLADYNGGPFQAYYFKKDSSRLSAETSGYVPVVLKKRKEYATNFKSYQVDKNLISQIADTSKGR